MSEHQRGAVAVKPFSVDFDVQGHPKPQARPRAFARKTKDGGAVARVYDPGTAEKWKSDIVLAGKDSRPASPLQGCIHVSIRFWMPRPKRLMREKDPDGAVFHDKKIDLDNLVKAILDALTTNGWWRDDSQVCRLTAEKMYHAKTGSAGAEIAIAEVDPIPPF